jgi:hypothetical protein
MSRLPWLTRLIFPFFINKNENCVQNSVPETIYRFAFHLWSAFTDPVSFRSRNPSRNVFTRTGYQLSTKPHPENRGFISKLSAFRWAIFQNLQDSFPRSLSHIEMRITYRIFVVKGGGKRPFRRLNHNGRMILKWILINCGFDSSGSR